MVEPIAYLQLVGDLTQKVYNFPGPKKEILRVKVQIISKIYPKEEYLGGQETIQSTSPNRSYVSSVKLAHYYPEKTLEEKMERAAIEYVGILRDMYFA